MEAYPWGESFQKKLLALMVREPVRTYAMIEPRFFTNPILVDLARIVQEVHQKHGPKGVQLSKSTLWALAKANLGKRKRELRPAYREVVRKLFKYRLADKEVILNQAFAFAKDQKFREALMMAEKDVNNGRYDVAVKRLKEAGGFGTDADLGIDYWKGLHKERWKVDRFNVIKTWYFRKLDRMMGGGLGGGELAIILSGSKIGKSRVLARIASGALWQGKNVALATGELSARKYRKRIDSMITGIAIEKLSKRGIRTKAVKILKHLRHQMKGSLFIKQFPSGKGSIGDVEGWVENLELAGSKIDMLVVDYLFLFNPASATGFKMDVRHRIGQVAVDLRGIAVEKNIPVWTASQGNRAALGKAVLGPKDFAEDISQFWTLDFLIALCQTKDEEERGEARFLLAAARDVGSGGIIDLQIEKETLRFREREVKKVG